MQDATSVVHVIEARLPRTSDNRSAPQERVSLLVTPSHSLSPVYKLLPFALQHMSIAFSSYFVFFLQIRSWNIIKPFKTRGTS